MFLYALLLTLPVLATGQGDHSHTHGPDGPFSLEPYGHTALILFRNVDRDRDGSINFPEKIAYYQRYDKDKNGQITRREFTTEITAENSHFRGHENQMYDLFDINVDNHLTESDFLHIFDINDYNSDGYVTMHEFITYWEKVFEAIEDTLIH